MTNEHRKLDCVRRLEIYLQHEKVEPIAAADVIAHNSSCYKCPDYHVCDRSANTVLMLYEEMKVIRDTPDIRIHSKGLYD